MFATIEFRLFILSAYLYMGVMLMFLSVMSGFAHPDTVREPLHIVGTVSVVLFLIVRTMEWFRLRKA